MKRLRIVLVLFIAFLVVNSGCSDYSSGGNPYDTMSSYMDGKYGGDGSYVLNLLVNGEVIDSSKPSVEFKFHPNMTADFIMVNIVPDEKRVEFKNVPISYDKETGVIVFDYNTKIKDKEINFSGDVSCPEYIGIMNLKVSR